MFLQETHSDVKTNKLWSTEWGNKIWFSNGATNARGVAIVFKKDFHCNVHNVILDENGRYIILYVTWNNKKWLLVNVYAPNDDSPIFFENLFLDVDKFAPDHVILGGDPNMGLDIQMDRSGNLCNNDRAAKWFNARLNTPENGLTDVWRHCHPDQHGFTWRKLNPKPVFSRLDYMIVSDSVVQFVQEISLLPGFRTDHTTVEMTLDFHVDKRGPGYWKFNVSLLRDKDYVDKINNLLDIELANEGKAKNKWELIKLAVRSSTLQFAARRHKSNKAKIELLEKPLKKLDRQAELGQGLDVENQRRLVKHELEDLIAEKTKGAVIRSRSNWALMAERPSKYFLNLEKKKAHSKTLHRLEKDDGSIVQGTKEILNEIKAF